MKAINDVDLQDAKALLMNRPFMLAATAFAAEVDRIQTRTIALHTELQQSMKSEEAGRMATQIVTDARAEDFTDSFKNLITNMAAALAQKNEETTH